MGEPEDSVTLADPAPVCQLLGFRPEIGLEEGMNGVIAWYRENYKTFDP
jgi:nucleoside-diphosphate-sugar epimerase